MKNLAIIPLVALTLAACKKENNTVPVPVMLTIDHVVNDNTLELDTMIYVNAAGNKYSVTRLQYYLSGFALIDEAGNETEIDSVFLVDVKVSDPATFYLGQLPQARYTGLKFNIGVVPQHNDTNGLPNTLANKDMVWPQQMGGGYHFMKFEGHFINNESTNSGFAVHLGTNDMLVNVSLNDDYKFGLDATKLHLRMDLSEWFKNPTDFDLNDGNYTMGNMALMSIIRDNGSDVFTMVK